MRRAAKPTAFLRRIAPARVHRIQTQLLRWYRRSGRDLPWRHTRDPYEILVSEVMLQQTQVERVIPKYVAWLEQWPTASALASAKQSDVLRAWSGLGYNRRALYLQRTAQAVTNLRKGKFPTDPDELQTLPGLGPYTSRAVAVFAFRQHVAMVDTNVRRVLGRLFFWPQEPTESAIRQLADSIVPSGAPDEWHHGLMDVGATICKSGIPKCESCPLKEHCAAYPKILTAQRVRRSRGAEKFVDSNRFWRGRIIATLLENPNLTSERLRSNLQTHGSISMERFRNILSKLVSERLITKQGKHWKILENEAS